MSQSLYTSVHATVVSHMVRDAFATALLPIKQVNSDIDAIQSLRFMLRLQ
jgi:hypothetical protein